jgi:N-acetyl-anhydromuramyl-L-alanine amidase AmpD
MKQVNIRRLLRRPVKMFGTAFATLLLCVAPAASVAANGQSSVEARIFASAATEFNVPKDLLLAVSYHQTRWETHSGEHSVDGGFGPMNLRTQVALHDDGHGDDRHRPATTPVTTGDFTLDRAAMLLGAPVDTLKTDTRQNIRGGAAVLAEKARALNNGSLPTDLTGWYTAVAQFSGAEDTRTAAMFADDVFATLKRGVSETTMGGQALSVSPESQLQIPDRGKVKTLGLRDNGFAPSNSDGSECPRNLNCRFVPAGYAQNSADPTDYGNYDHSNRPKDMKVKYIIIHNTEGSYTSAIAHFQNPKSYVSAHYIIRSADGAITQMLSTKDTGWHAGDWWVNMHSIGIEHEGKAAQGATWYTEAMYRASADLVRYLSKKYSIPLDRDHIIGHDNVPGLTDRKAAVMHWDPGPYWDWNHYMDLVQQKPAGTNARNKQNKNGNVVTINPDLSQNMQTVRVCDAAGANCVEQTLPSNFVFLRTAPRPDAALITDTLLHPGGEPGTIRINDWTAKAATGQQYALAEKSGDWTAIWHSGQKAWFYNPASQPTASITKGKVLTLKPGLDNVNVYGGAYPEMSVYPPEVVAPVQPRLAYTIKAGQKYVSKGVVPTDYFYDRTVDSSAPYDHVIFKGDDKFIQVWYNQRTMFVRATDVNIE